MMADSGAHILCGHGDLADLCDLCSIDGPASCYRAANQGFSANVAMMADLWGDGRFWGPHFVWPWRLGRLVTCAALVAQLLATELLTKDCLPMWL